MSTTITRDMTVDPGGSFLGEGAIQFPWAPNAINARTRRSIISPPADHNARRYWSTDPVAIDGQFSYTYKLTFRSVGSTTSGYMRVGHFLTAEASNDRNSIFVEMYWSPSPSVIRFLARRMSSLGVFAQGANIDIAPASVWDVLLRIEATFSGRVFTVRVYRDSDNYLFGTSTLNLTGETLLWNTNSFGLSGRTSSVSTESYLKADIYYFTSWTFGPTKFALNSAKIKNAVFRSG